MAVLTIATTPKISEQNETEATFNINIEIKIAYHRHFVLIKCLTKPGK